VALGSGVRPVRYRRGRCAGLPVQGTRRRLGECGTGRATL